MSFEGPDCGLKAMNNSYWIIAEERSRNDLELYLDEMKLLAQELASSYGEQRQGNINIPGIQQKKRF